MEWRNTHWVWASTWGSGSVGPDSKHELPDVAAAITVQESLAECRSIAGRGGMRRAHPEHTREHEYAALEAGYSNAHECCVNR
jgi:hypothetical protein